MNEESVKLLAIDDDEKILDMLKDVISINDTILDLAKNGLEGISKIEEKDYDVSLNRIFNISAYPIILVRMLLKS